MKSYLQAALDLTQSVHAKISIGMHLHLSRYCRCSLFTASKKFITATQFIITVEQRRQFSSGGSFRPLFSNELFTGSK
jgi:hypothetical protein